MNSQGEVEYCMCSCGHRHRKSEREIAVYRGMVTALWRVFKWCEVMGRHEFEMREVRDMIGRIEYTRFGDWKKFGGLVYSPPGIAKAHYGLNMDRCEKFFAGELKIPLKTWKNPITGELKPEEPRSIREVPSLSKMLNEDDEYIARYRKPTQVNML